MVLEIFQFVSVGIFASAVFFFIKHTLLKAYDICQLPWRLQFRMWREWLRMSIPLLLMAYIFLLFPTWSVEPDAIICTSHALAVVVIFVLFFEKN